jgi:SNF2 family DNA or RNA helicase
MECHQHMDKKRRKLHSKRACFFLCDIIDPDDPIYDLEISDEIEDLGSSHIVDSVMEETSVWRQSRYRVTKTKIEKAVEIEDEFLAKNNIKINSHVEDEDDTKAIVEEERNCSSTTSRGGVSRVRRDDVQALRQRRKRPNSVLQQSSVKLNTRSSSRQPPKTTANRDKEDHFSLVDEDTSRAPSSLNVPPLPSNDSGIFASSSFTLCGVDEDSDAVTKSKKRTITIASPLAKILKTHQREGIDFMFRNTFADFAFVEKDDAEKAKTSIGGCILAHNMGLGKSLSCVALLHALFHHPSLKSSGATRRLVHTVLLVVPVNTLANWENEFDKWTGSMRNARLEVCNLVNVLDRRRAIERWGKNGGILLVTDQTFRIAVKKKLCLEHLQSPGPDVIVLDEAHMMLKKKSNEIFKVLDGVATPRRICLTGSPFQNNLFEYFRMASYVRYVAFLGMN